MDNTNKKKNTFLSDFLTIIVVAAVTLLFSKYVIGLTAVIGNSMNDTYKDGQFLLTKKYSTECERFDVVVFYTKSDGEYIKRVIGLPGETVRIDSEGNIYINEELLEENYGKETIKDPGNALYGITLGEDEYFVMGDNRNNSEDSRFDYVGAVNKDDLIGIIMFTK